MRYTLPPHNPTRWMKVKRATRTEPKRTGSRRRYKVVQGTSAHEHRPAAPKRGDPRAKGKPPTGS
eukprot:9269467-Alexandrium_andersonii.AAC.1